MTEIGKQRHTVYVQSYDAMPDDTAFTIGDGSRIYPQSATIWMEAGELHRIDLTITLPNIDVKAVVDTVTFDCPVCQKSLEHYCNGEE